VSRAGRPVAAMVFVASGAKAGSKIAWMMFIGCPPWFTAEAVADKLKKGPGLSSLACCVARGWGIRSVHAPENRYVVGLRSTS
jgi:hypothetical protein